MFKIEPIIESIKFLDISDEVYFGEQYRDYISNSRLKLINPDEGGSPQKYNEGFSKHGSFSDSLYFGSAVHENILQPADFKNVVCDRPTAKLGFVMDEIVKNRRKGMSIYNSIVAASNKIDYYKDKLTDGVLENIFKKGLKYYLFRKKFRYTTGIEPIFLNPADYGKLTDCLASVEKNRNIQKLLHPVSIFTPPMVVNEGTLLMDVKVTVDDQEVILKLKAKLDNFTVDFDTNSLVLNDLKTTGHYLSKFEESFEKYHYYRQMGMYSWMLMMWAKKEFQFTKPMLTANMLVVSTVPNYYSGVFKVRNSDINRGFKEFIRLLKVVAYCKVYGFDREPNIQ